MSPAPNQSPALTPLTAGFALAAAITALFNTALACAKDAYPGFNSWMQSLTGHHWVTHGFADLALFLCLGLLFTRSNLGGKIKPGRLIAILIASVAIAAAGLLLWFAFV